MQPHPCFKFELIAILLCIDLILSNNRQDPITYIVFVFSACSKYSLAASKPYSGSSKIADEKGVNSLVTNCLETIKKKGYDGHTSFKHHLKEQALNFTNIDQTDAQIRRSILKNEQEVTRTINLLDTGVIEDAIQKSKNAKRVVIFARGFSEVVGAEMQTKLQLLGKCCELYTDPNIIKTISTRLLPSDVVIFISLSGETKELITAAKNCYQAEIGTILITSTKESSLADLVGLSLRGYKLESSLFPNYEVRSRLPLLVIVRILLDAYVIRTK